MHRLIFLLGILLFVARAQAQMIDFDLPFQAVDDISIQGVVFDFKVGGLDSGEAFVGSFGPGNLSTVTDPSLTGPSAGVLTLSFDVPTPTLSFGVALSTASSLKPGFEVRLFDAADQLLQPFQVDTEAFGPVAFSEAQFSYTGLPVSKAVIDFADEPGDFAFDNLVYQIPEPAGGLLLLSGLAGIVLRTKRQRESRS